MIRLVSLTVLTLLSTTGRVCAADDRAESPTALSASVEAAEAETGLRMLLPRVANPLALAGRVDKRLFGIIPNHRAEQESADYKPLKTWEKFKIAERDTFDWPNYFLTAGFAFQTQIAEHGWHGRAVGRNFGEYYARSLADQAIGNFIVEAALPSLFHEDPRFFRSGVGPVWKRAFKASRQVLVTRGENGKSRFNFSEVVGNSAVVAITSLYYPDSRRFGPGLQRVGLQIGNDVFSNLMTEFWPDVKRHMQPLLHWHRAAD